MKLHSIFPKSIVLIVACILFSSFCVVAQNPSFPVTGKVIDDNGKGLPGVTVTVKGSTTSVVTTADGTYRINAASGKDVLVFTYVGYQPTELAINKRSVVDLSLTLSQKLLDDVVVIGYGTQKKGNVSFAVSKLKNDNFDQRPITRVDQALVGQLAGVTVKQSTGVPGRLSVYRCVVQVL